MAKVQGGDTLQGAYLCTDRKGGTRQAVHIRNIEEAGPAFKSRRAVYYQMKLSGHLQDICVTAGQCRLTEYGVSG